MSIRGGTRCVNTFPARPIEAGRAEQAATSRASRAVKSALRAEDYRAKAAASAQLAEDSDLPQVRQKHELAASTWLSLAALDDQPSALGRRIAAKLSRQGELACPPSEVFPSPA
jgi:hypothetical protein